MTKVRLTISLISENDSDKYRSDEKWFEQISSSEWLEQNNTDFFQKVIAAFNGVEWKKHEH